MYFETLQNRLVARLKDRLHQGDFTERGLAHFTGISQPHMHNMLKGKRILSPEIGDRILHKLQMSVLDLFERPELEGLMVIEGGRTYREIPVLEGRLGPGATLPIKRSSFERYPLPNPRETSVMQPVFARLASDARMAPIVQENDLALLDQAPDRRSDFQPNALCVVSVDGEGLVRRVRHDGRGLLLTTEDARDSDPGRRLHVPLDGGHVLDIVKARVVWIGRMVE